MPKWVILANYWNSSYKISLFSELHKKYKNFKVIYVADSEMSRQWLIDQSNIDFPYEKMFNGNLDDVGLLEMSVETFDRLKALDPEILIISGYNLVAYVVGFLWAKYFDKKIILWSSSNEEDKYRLFPLELIKRALVKRCDAANVYGTRSRDYLIKLGMDKRDIFIKGNVTNNDFYYSETMKAKEKRAELCKELNIPARNFLYLGRFSKEKNLKHLLGSYGELQSEEWGMILVGDGPQKDEITKFIDDNMIARVYMPGFKQKQDIPTYLAVSDVLVLPSISETWGLVVNEAMASALPVLVSKRCGCYPDLIQEGKNGFSFDPYNDQELYNHLRNIVDGKYDLEAMGEISRSIISKFTLQNAAEIIIRTVDHVM